MKLITLALLSSLSFEVFAAEGKAQVFGNESEQIVQITGDAALVLYNKLSASTITSRTDDQNPLDYIIIKSGDSYDCTLSVKVELSGQKYSGQCLMRIDNPSNGKIVKF